MTDSTIDSMKAATTEGFITKSHLLVKETRLPKPAANEVLVKIAATSVNPKDWKLNTNISSLIPGIGSLRPFIIGDDLSGEVVELGSAVTEFSVGDQVYGMDMRLRTAAAAEYAVINKKRIAIKPANISHTQAAVVPLAALTAYQAYLKGNLQQGQRLLIIGASGGVGTFAVQIAKAMGAEITAVCSGRNSELVKSLGADHLIDYTQEDFQSREEDFDMVFDVTSYETPQSCASLLKEGGVFVTTMGYLKPIVFTGFAKLSPNKKKAKIVMVESYTEHLNAIREMIEKGEVTPIIDSEFSLAEIDKAYQRSKSGRARGKIAINVA